jgi:hypothetical protein
MTEPVPLERNHSEARLHDSVHAFKKKLSVLRALNPTRSTAPVAPSRSQISFLIDDIVTHFKQGKDIHNSVATLRQRVHQIQEDISNQFDSVLQHAVLASVPSPPPRNPTGGRISFTDAVVGALSNQESRSGADHGSHTAHSKAVALLERLRHKAQEVGHESLSVRILAGSLQLLLEALCAEVQAERGSIFMYDEDTDELRSVCMCNLMEPPEPQQQQAATASASSSSSSISSSSSMASAAGTSANATSPTGLSALKRAKSSVHMLSAGQAKVAVSAGGVREIRISSSTGIAGSVFRTGIPVNLQKNVYEDRRFSPVVDSMSGFQTKTILCWPLRSFTTDRVVGVLQVLNKWNNGAFGKADESFSDSTVMLMCRLIDRIPKTDYFFNQAFDFSDLARQTSAALHAGAVSLSTAVGQNSVARRRSVIFRSKNLQSDGSILVQIKSDLAARQNVEQPRSLQDMEAFVRTMESAWERRIKEVADLQNENGKLRSMCETLRDERVLAEKRIRDLERELATCEDAKSRLREQWVDAVEASQKLQTELQSIPTSVHDLGLPLIALSGKHGNAKSSPPSRTVSPHPQPHPHSGRSRSNSRASNSHLPQIYVARAPASDSPPADHHPQHSQPQRGSSPSSRKSSSRSKSPFSTLSPSPSPSPSSATTTTATTTTSSALSSSSVNVDIADFLGLIPQPVTIVHLQSGKIYRANAAFRQLFSLPESSFLKPLHISSFGLAWDADKIRKRTEHQASQSQSQLHSVPLVLASGNDDDDQTVGQGRDAQAVILDVNLLDTDSEALGNEDVVIHKHENAAARAKAVVCAVPRPMAQALASKLKVRGPFALVTFLVAADTFSV